MIVQLLGGPFDGAESEVEGHEINIAIAYGLLPQPTDCELPAVKRYCLYAKSKDLKYRYRFVMQCTESQLKVLYQFNEMKGKKK